MKKKKRGWIWFLVIVAAILAAVIVLPMILRAGNTNANAQQYEAVKVVTGDISVSVHGTGSIEAMDTKTVTANASAKVDAVLVQEGDAVTQGQLLATLNIDAANSKIDSLKQQIVTQDATIAGLRAAPVSKILYAPVEARVKILYAQLNDDVNVAMSANGALIVLSTDGRMKVSFIPAAGAAVLPGEAVKLMIDGKAISGFISTVPDSTTDKAEALITDDSYAVGAQAVVQDTAGAELGQGILEINRPLRITADTGKLYHFYVKANDKVKSGAKLIKLTGTTLSVNFEAQLVKRQQLQDDLDEAIDSLKDYSITAPTDGIVTGLVLKENGLAQDGMTVCTIQQNTGFKLVLAVDELDIPKIKAGQNAAVKIDALPDEPATGIVTKISPIGAKANDVTTYDVTLSVAAPSALAGMNASADIETAFKTNVLLVPVEAIHTVDGKSFVYGPLSFDLLPTPSPAPGATAGSSSNPIGDRVSRFFGQKGTNQNATNEQRPIIYVTVGLINDSMAEITSGLKEGDTIAVPIAQSTSNSLFGGMGGQYPGSNAGSSTGTSPGSN
jgi:HlyD family secretion protein